MVRTYSESVDGSNDGLADVDDLGPVAQKVLRVVLDKVSVLHLLDIGTSYVDDEEKKKKKYATLVSGKERIQRNDAEEKRQDGRTW